MVLDSLDSAAEAAKLALKMGSAASKGFSFMPDISRELPFISPVLKTVHSIKHKVDCANGLRDELAALRERCM